MSATHTIVGSPVGDLTVVGERGVLTGVYFDGQRHRPGRAVFGPRADEEFAEAARQFAGYFAGERTEFDLPLAPSGDEFQCRVWELLKEIPYGRTCSYGDLARQLGDVALSQAVGAAVGRNPLGVIVPCHRVIGADGSLTGYAGGLDRKRFLLELEEPAEVRAGRLF